MQRLAEICIRRPVFASMLILALVVIGAAAYTRLGVDRFPAVDIPQVRVRAVLPGAAPEEMETEVAQPLEEAVNTVEGLDELRSISGAGASFLAANFQLERDVDVAAQDVRDRVSAALVNLPPDLDPPVVAKFDNESSPVLTVALSSDLPLRELTDLADRVVKRAARARPRRRRGAWSSAGSSAPSTSGSTPTGSPRCGLPITAVRDAILRQNSQVPGGNVTTPTVESSLRTHRAAHRSGGLRRPRPRDAQRHAHPRARRRAAPRTAPRSSARSPGSTTCRRSSSRCAGSRAPTPSR